MNTSLGSSNSVLGTVLAVIAVILSAIALYFGAAARNVQSELKTANSNLDERVAQVSSQTEMLSNELGSFEGTAQRQFEALGTKLLMIENRTAPRANQPPSGAASSRSEGSTTEVVYKVKSGDLLGRIAKKHNTTVEAILKANPDLDARRLRVDQKIKVPVPAQARPVQPPVE